MEMTIKYYIIMKYLNAILTEIVFEKITKVPLILPKF
jgi:hypothetical protein